MLFNSASYYSLTLLFLDVATNEVLLPPVAIELGGIEPKKKMQKIYARSLIIRKIVPDAKSAATIGTLKE
jgi:hypothetical protein